MHVPGDCVMCVYLEPCHLITALLFITCVRCTFMYGLLGTMYVSAYLSYALVRLFGRRTLEFLVNVGQERYVERVVLENNVD
eukprot:m.98438 g.98438  ORF g.98438 m.98438 type:complete len:82 (-) comp12519_c1_seq2:1370-1615(-)